MNITIVAMNNLAIEERQRQVASLVARSMTQQQIAEQLRVGQATIHRDIEALKEKSQQFVHDLAKSDLAHYFKQSIDIQDAVIAEAWQKYYSADSSITIQNRLHALRIISDAAVRRFEMLQNGPEVLAIRSLNQRLERIERIEKPEIPR